jgi:hypothetical protein
VKARAPDVARGAAECELGSAVTLRIPLAALSGVVVQAPPPALVSSDTGADHVGLTPAGLREHLAWMARDPRWRGSVIVASRKRRLAAPADVIASMRERYGAARETDEAANDAPGDDRARGVDAVLAVVGAERVPRRARGARS